MVSFKESRELLFKGADIRRPPFPSRSYFNIVIIVLLFAALVSFGSKGGITTQQLIIILLLTIWPFAPHRICLRLPLTFPFCYHSARFGQATAERSSYAISFLNIHYLCWLLLNPFIFFDTQYSNHQEGCNVGKIMRVSEYSAFKANKTGTCLITPLLWTWGANYVLHRRYLSAAIKHCQSHWPGIKPKL